MSSVHSALVQVSKAVGAIGKDRRNTQQNYQFRGVDDVMDALHKPLADAGVIIVPEVIHQEWGTWTYGNDRREGVTCVLTIRYHVFGPDGDRLEPAPVFVGEARDTGDKAANKAMSTAYKYMAFQLFCIPVSGQDEADAQQPPAASPMVLDPTNEVAIKQHLWTELAPFYPDEAERKKLLRSYSVPATLEEADELIADLAEQATGAVEPEGDSLSPAPPDERKGDDHEPRVGSHSPEGGGGPTHVGEDPPPPLVELAKAGETGKSPIAAIRAWLAKAAPLVAEHAPDLWNDLASEYELADVAAVDGLNTSGARRLLKDLNKALAEYLAERGVEL